MRPAQIYSLIATTLVIGGLFAVYQLIPAQRTTPEEPETTQADITNIFSTTTSDEVDSFDTYDQTPDSPYVDLDPKLHISKGFVLDPKIIRIDYTLKDIEFCGNTYKAKQVFIDGVDIAQRLSEIFKEDKKKSDWWCGMTLGRSVLARGVIGSGEEIHVTLDRSGSGYSFRISLGLSFVNLTSGTPHSLDFGFDNIVKPDENKIVDIMGNLIGELHKSQ